jgi:hypothetical protein
MIGDAALAIWFEVAAPDLEDLDAWYPRQHLPERLSVPGFLRGRRYAATGGGLPFFTLYETRDVAVLSSAAYLERLNNPTDWTRRVLPTFRHMLRNAYRLAARSPRDLVRPDLATVRIKPDSGRGPHVRQWLERDGVAAVSGVAGVAAVGLYASDTSGTSVATEERRIVGGQVEPATPFLAVCELDGPGAAEALGDFWRGWGRKLAAEVTVDTYRLMYGLGWL